MDIFAKICTLLDSESEDIAEFYGEYNNEKTVCHSERG